MQENKAQTKVEPGQPGSTFYLPLGAIEPAPERQK